MTARPVGERVPLTERVRRWRLNAPEGYRWTSDEVLGEKTQSLLNGLILGALCWPVVVFVVLAVVR